MQTMWEKLDLKIGGIFQKGEKSLNLPTKTREWSPALDKLGAECCYWKARHYNATTGEDVVIKDCQN
jgi:hypothetical protein